ncbi:MAG: hypothetical protein ACI3W5_15170 [Faecousia sp.]
MNEEMVMRKLIRELIRVGASEELTEAVVSFLSTEKESKTIANYEEMIRQLKPLKNPTETCLLGKALLIAEQE